MDEEGKIILQATADKASPGGLIRSEQIMVYVKRIKLLKVEYESLKKASLRTKCYVLDCSPSTLGNCYSPTCAHLHHIQQELTILLKAVLVARNSAVSAINEITSIVNAPKREVESDAGSPSNKRCKYSCEDLQTGRKIISNSSSDSPNSRSSRSSTASVNSTAAQEATNCCLKQRCASILSSESLNDVIFIVGQGHKKETIPAHKLILSIGSEVFKAMFSKMRSRRSPETIKIPDVKPSAFSALLKFLYTDEVTLTSDTTMDVLYAARKYSVQPLEDHCISILIKNLCLENAFALLHNGRCFADQRLIDASLEVIDSDTDAAVLTHDFCSIKPELLRMVLERDSLTIEEIKLFHAVLRWSVAECGRTKLSVNQENQKLVLEGLLPLIRFPLMSLEDISSTVTSAGLLTNEELLSLYQYLCKNPKPPIFCNSLPRFWTKVKVNRFEEIDCPCNSDCDAIQFKVDRDVRMLGVGLYGSLCGPSCYSVKLYVKDLRAKDLILVEMIDCDYNGATLTYEALFKNPIKLSAAVDYAVWAKVSGPDSFYGKSGVKKVAVDLPHNRTVTVNFSTCINIIKSPRTNVSEGQIPELIFSA